MWTKWWTATAAKNYLQLICNRRPMTSLGVNLDHIAKVRT